MKGKPLTILLIEDNEDHAEIVRRSFSTHQVSNKIHYACDGEVALDYLLRRKEYSNPDKSPRPDVILLDLRLPKIDGLQVLEEIKKDEALSLIPVIVLTSSEEKADVLEAYHRHANSYVVKPLEFTKFTNLMRDMGHYWLGWNVTPLARQCGVKRI